MKRSLTDSDTPEQPVEKKQRVELVDRPLETKSCERPERGCIFHWGPYSYSAFDAHESAKLRKIQNGSEWYLKRLLDAQQGDKCYRPTSGAKQTLAYHNKTFGPNVSYWDFVKSFAPDVDATRAHMKQWMEIAKTFGATYVILTAKHHDGFCLWPTRTVEAPRVSKHDWVLEFKQAAGAAGLKFGLYFSWMEFEQRPTADFLSRIAHKQLIELTAYEPQILWCDGDWQFKNDTVRHHIHTSLRVFKQELSGINVEINDRLADPALIRDPCALGSPGKQLATYRAYADRAMLPLPVQRLPEEKRPPWEHINTIGLSWGRNRAQKLEHYKTGKQLLELARRVEAQKGRFLLNFGPDAEAKAVLDFNALDENDHA